MKQFYKNKKFWWAYFAVSLPILVLGLIMENKTLENIGFLASFLPAGGYAIVSGINNTRKKHASANTNN